MKKITILITLFFFIDTHLYSQELPDLIPYLKGNKWGYVDKSKKIKIPAKFDYAGLFEDGSAIVRVGENTGTIDKNGNYIIKPFYLRPGYLNFFEGLEPIKDTITNRYGYINKKGEWVIKPKYYEAGYFQNGVARVCVLEKTWLFIDKNENHLCPPQPFTSGTTYPYGFAIICKNYLEQKNSYNQKFGLMNKNGKLILEVIYQKVIPINSNFFQIVKDDKTGFVDSTGKEILPFIYDYTTRDPEMFTGYFIDGLSLIGKDGKWGSIDTTGKIITPLKYDKLKNLGEGVFAVTDSISLPKDLNTQFYYYVHFINKNEEIIIPQLKLIGKPLRFKNGFCKIMEFPMEIMKQNSEFATFSFINMNGKRLNIDSAIDVGDFSEGLAMIVNQNKKMGFIDTTGKTVIKCQYDIKQFNSNAQFHNGLCIVYKGDKFFFIDKKGNEYYQEY